MKIWKNSGCVETLFELALRGFDHEYDRIKKMESKAGIFISSIGIMFTLSSGYIDIRLNEVPYYTRQISILIFLMSDLCYAIGIIYFSKVLKSQKYDILKYKKLFTKEVMNDYNEEELKIEVIKEYRHILDDFKNSNENKADYYDIGVTASISGFILTFILMYIDFIN